MPASTAAILLTAGIAAATLAGGSQRFPGAQATGSVNPRIASGPAAPRGSSTTRPGRVASTMPPTTRSPGTTPAHPLPRASTPAVPQAPVATTGPSGATPGSTTPPGAPVSEVGPVPATPIVSVLPLPGSPFLRACGIRLCLGRTVFGLYGGSTLGGLGDPTGRVALAKQAHLNIIRIVNFLDEKSHDLAHAPYDPVRWARVDREVATARGAGLRVILDLSSYRNLLANNNVNPYTRDWAAFLTFVTARVNTVTHVRYRDDPTIAIIAIAGEVEPLTVVSPMTPTTLQLTNFYRRTIAELHARDAHHLVSSGGLLQINWNSGIDWRAIFALAGDDVPAIHVYSLNDERTTLPAVAAYARGLGKPWIIEEFGFRQTLGDGVRALSVQRVFNEAATARAAGVLFWNVGPELVGVNGKTETYDINPATPKTFAVVLANRGRW